MFISNSFLYGHHSLEKDSITLIRAVMIFESSSLSLIFISFSSKSNINVVRPCIDLVVVYFGLLLPSLINKSTVTFPFTGLPNVKDVSTINLTCLAVITYSSAGRAFTKNFGRMYGFTSNSLKVSFNKIRM